MSSQFHNRLVGVTILVTSIVIFLPSIIDGKKATYEDEFVSTPIQPELKEHTKNKVFDIKTSESKIQTAEASDKSSIENNDWKIEPVADTVSISPSKKTTNPKTVQENKKSAIPQQAWTIQLGAFQNAKNINTLLKKLHKAGFQAHTIPRSVIDGELTRVFVGPDISKKKLEKQIPQLKRLTKLQGKLLPFDAVNP